WRWRKLLPLCSQSYPQVLWIKFLYVLLHFLSGKVRQWPSTCRVFVWATYRLNLDGQEALSRRLYCPAILREHPCQSILSICLPGLLRFVLRWAYLRACCNVGLPGAEPISPCLRSVSNRQP